MSSSFSPSLSFDCEIVEIETFPCVFVVRLSSGKFCQEILRKKEDKIITEDKELELQIERVHDDALIKKFIEKLGDKKDLTTETSENKSSEPDSLGSFEIINNPWSKKPHTPSPVSPPLKIQPSLQKVEDIKSFDPETKSLEKRIVKVSSINRHLLNELRILLETESRGGGDIETGVVSEGGSIAYFVFANPEVAANWLEKGQEKVANHIVKFEKAELFEYRSMSNFNKNGKDAAEVDEDRSPSPQKTEEKWENAKGEQTPADDWKKSSGDASRKLKERHNLKGEDQFGSHDDIGDSIWRWNSSATETLDSNIVEVVRTMNSYKSTDVDDYFTPEESKSNSDSENETVGEESEQGSKTPAGSEKESDIGKEKLEDDDKEMQTRKDNKTAMEDMEKGICGMKLDNKGIVTDISGDGHDIENVFENSASKVAEDNLNEGKKESNDLDDAGRKETYIENEKDGDKATGKSKKGTNIKAKFEGLEGDRKEPQGHCGGDDNKEIVLDTLEHDDGSYVGSLGDKFLSTPDNTIVVYGIPFEDFIEEILITCLEHRKYGGGNISGKGKYDESHHSVTVTFDDVRVAQGFIGKKTLKLQGHELHFRSLVDERKKIEERSRTIIVRNVWDEDVSDMLICILEKTERGGGRTEMDEFNVENREMVVRYIEKTVADRWKAKKKVEVIGVTYDIVGVQHCDLCSEKDENNVNNRVIYFAGITKNICEDFLVSLRGRKLHAPIAGSRFLENENVLEVTFSDKLDAQKLLEMESIKFSDRTIKIVSSISELDENLSEDKGRECVYAVVDDNFDSESFHSVDDDDNEGVTKHDANLQTDSEKLTLIEKYSGDIKDLQENFGKLTLTSDDELTLLRNLKKLAVEGIPQDVSSGILGLYFQKPKYANGRCEVIHFDKEGKNAIVEFDDPEVAFRVSNLEHSIREKVKVYLLEENPNNFQSHAILVKCIGKVDVSLLPLYFENPRSSGGKVIECDTRDDSFCYVVFEDVKSVDDVLRRNHELAGHRLDVQALPSQPPPPFVKDEIVDKKKLLVLYFKENIDLKYFTDIVERVGKARLEGLLQGKGCLLLSFYTPPDYFELRKHTSCYPVKGYMVSVRRAAYTNQIQVALPAEADPQLIQEFFQSKSKEKVKVNMDSDSGLTVVTFETHKSASDLLSSDVIFNDRRVPAKPYYECLGVNVVEPLVPSSTKIFYKPEVLDFIVSRSKIKQEIERFIDVKFSAEVLWQVNTRDEIELKLKSDNSGLSHTWKKDGEIEMKEILKPFYWREKNVLQELWNEVKEQVTAYIEHMPRFRGGGHDIGMKYDDEACDISFIGNEIHCNQLGKRIDEIIEKTLAKKRQVREIMSTLNPLHLNIIMRLDDIVGNTDCNVCLTDEGLVLEGCSDMVKNVKLMIYEKSNCFCSDEPEFDVTVDNFVRQGEILQYLNELFVKKNVLASVADAENHLVVIGSCENSLTDAVKLVKSIIKRDSISMGVNQSCLVRLEIWKDFVKKMKNDLRLFNLELVESPETMRDNLSYTCVDDIEEQLKTILQKFLADNELDECRVDMDVDILNALGVFFEQDLKDLEASIEKCGGKLKKEASKKESGILLVCKKSDLESNKKKIKNWTSKIISEKSVIKKPGLPDYFETDCTARNIKFLEKNYKVCIYKETKEINSFSFEDKFEIVVGDNIFIDLVHGDITNIKVDTIVDVNFSKLNPTTGVSKKIFEAGGDKMKSSVREYLNYTTLVSSNDVYVSNNVGSLPCFQVIHVIEEMWKDGNSSEADMYSAGIQQVLGKVNEKRFESVSIPCSDGTDCNFPKQVISKTLVDTLETFLKEISGSLKRIYLVCENVETLKLYQPLLNDWQKRNEQEGRESEGRGENEEAAEAGGSRRHSEMFEYIQMDNPSSFSGLERKKNESVVKSKIELIKGSISNVTADVIINSTGLELHLIRGQVSKSLLTTAGAEIQKECSDKRPKNFAYGDIVSTKGYNLKCKYVFHTSCKGWSNKSGEGEAIIRKIVHGALKKSTKKSCKTVAFPALGTGNLKAPPDQVALTMFDEVVKYFERNKTTTIQKVYFVIYNKDLPCVTAFENCMAGFLSSADNPSSSDGSALDIDVSDPCNIDMGMLKVEVVEGDITASQSDAIVNSTNDKLDLSSGAVSKAILKKGGGALADELKNAKMQSNGVCLTKGGNLPAGFIVHVVAQKEYSAWYKIIIAALKEADSYGCTSITFPVLGTGNFGLSVKTMAQVMVGTFNEFSRSPECKNIKKITVCIFLKKMVNEFLDGVKKINSDREGSTGVLPTLGKLFSSAVKAISGAKQSIENYFNPKSEGVRVMAKSIDDSLVSLSVYGIDKENINKAFEQLMKDITDAFVEKIFDSEKDKELIGKMNEDQIARLKALRGKCKVIVKIDNDEKLRRIALAGFQENLTDATNDVHAIFMEIKREDAEKIEAEMLKNEVFWEYRDIDDAYKAYPPKLNFLLENAHSNKKFGVAWQEGQKRFFVDFNLMEEASNNDVVKIRRRVKGDDLPQSWTSVPDTEKYLAVQLSPTDNEFLTVQSNIMSSAGNTVKTIHKIERIQNPSLYKMYQARKSAMEKSTPGFQVERNLWHGTSDNVVPNINESGFNRSYCGKNATVYGRGVYFAQNFHYSGHNTYSPPNSSGLKHVYQCKVLAGEFALGSQTYMVPPPKPNKTSENYDSVVNNVQKPEIFVVFFDSQAYPEYLVYFS